MPGCSSKDDATCMVLNNITHKISGNIISASSTHTERSSESAQPLCPSDEEHPGSYVKSAGGHDSEVGVCLALISPPRSRRDFPFTHWSCGGTTCLMSIAAFEWLLVNAPPTVTEGATSPNPPRH